MATALDIQRPCYWIGRDRAIASYHADLARTTVAVAATSGAAADVAPGFNETSRRGTARP